MSEQVRIEEAKQEYKDWVEMHDGLLPSEDLAEFEETAEKKWWLIEEAESASIIRKQVEELQKELEQIKILAIECDADGRTIQPYEILGLLSK